MSSRLQALVEERAKIWEEMREILDEGERNNRPPDLESYNRRDEQLDGLTKEIDARRKAEELEAKLSETQPEPKLNGNGLRAETRPTANYDTAFWTYVRRGERGLDHVQSRILNDGLVELGPEGRALSTSGTAGGYTIPQEFLRDLVRTMKAFGAVQRVARTITTDSGASMPFPAVDDTSNVGAILAENTQVSEQDVAFTQKTLGAFMYTSKLTRVSRQLLMDTGFNLEEELNSLLGERIARILNQHFTTGAGTTEPQGLVTGGTSGVTAASATAVTSDEIISLAHSVDPAYRNSGRARFMMRDAAVAGIRKLKDTTNQYLWQPSLQAGVPDTLFGYPVEINQDMPAMTTGLKPIAFGDFYEGYLIREVRGVQLLRLEERYADYLQVGFLAFARYDGLVRNAAAYRLITMA